MKNLISNQPSHKMNRKAIFSGGLLVCILVLLIGIGFGGQSSHEFGSKNYLIPSIGHANPQEINDQQAYLPSIFGPPAVTGGFPIVFVSRQIPPEGSLYYQQGGSLPGTGPYSRFTSAAPGKLMLLYPNGSLEILVDGSNPNQATFNLVDVNGPEVSYDGTKIVFAGLPAGNYQSTPREHPGKWRIFKINTDGSGLEQITFSDRNIDLSQFDPVNEFEKYDDFDPVWLPDGRIAFSSTRWPSLGMYQDVQTTNLFVMNSDGSNMRRITSERNGAERPMVDPLTGKIVYSRWWRNFRNGANSLGTVEDPIGDGLIMDLGLVAESKSGDYGNGPNAPLGRNSWQLATVNPDGTGLAQWGGVSGVGSDAFSNQAYGGTFAQDGSIYTTFYPMHHLAEAAGFGGIRHYPRGPHGYSPIIGVADEGQQLVRNNPPSHRVFVGPYAAEPEVLPDGRVIISWAGDTDQDYGLYIMDADGSNLTLLYDAPGTTELRARLVRPRPLPPIIPDQVTTPASALPPLENPPYDIDGTFTFNALNVYFNAPVDAEIVDAIPIGSAASIRFYLDHQRTSYGFPERLDWPILLDEVTVHPDGSISPQQAPANLPLFEQIRSPQPLYDIPLTGSTNDGERGAAHVAGLNFGPPGSVATCVGCHAGHTMIEVPENLEDAQWTNLAPGASVRVSSVNSMIENLGAGLIDRRVNSGEGLNRYWLSENDGQEDGQWIELIFPVPIKVRSVRLYPLPLQAGIDIAVKNAEVQLFTDLMSETNVGHALSGELIEPYIGIEFDDIQAQVVRINLDAVDGEFAGLAEVEVIGSGGLE